MKKMGRHARGRYAEIWSIGIGRSSIIASAESLINTGLVPICRYGDWNLATES